MKHIARRIAKILGGIFFSHSRVDSKHLGYLPFEKCILGMETIRVAGKAFNPQGMLIHGTLFPSREEINPG